MVVAFRRSLTCLLAVLLCVLVLPGSAFAADPVQVQLTLEGCRLPDPPASACTSSDFTTGNLGKNWAELDLVSHRLTMHNNGADQVFDIRLSADHLLAGVAGYDFLTTPVAAGCAISVLDANVVSPLGVVGGVDRALTTLIRVDLDADDTCVVSYAARLALGSHLYSGSSLQSQVLEADYDAIGQRTVSIPVNEIEPQEISKTASATSTPQYTWALSKTSPTTGLTINSCEPAPTSPNVTYTVAYSRTVSPGAILTVSGVITLTNPANRPLIADVSDAIKIGSTVVGGGSLGTFTVPANGSVQVPYSFPVSQSGTLTNTASAVYHDPDKPGVLLTPLTTQVAVPVAVVELTPLGNTATVTDTESITGGLVYTRTSPSPAGPTTGDTFSFGVSAPGSTTISKIVSAPQPMNGSGVLTNRVTLQPSDQLPLVTTTDVVIPVTVVAADPQLTVRKTVDVAPDDATTFSFTITNLDTGATTATTATVDAGNLSGDSAPVPVAPSAGGYRVTEGTPPAGWVAAAPVVTSALALCGSGTAVVSNTREVGSLTVNKTVVGGEGTFTFLVDCTDNAFDRTLTFTGTGTQTIGGIPTGVTCTVTEQPAEGWTPSPSGPQTVTIDADGASVSVVNTRDVGALTVTKAIEGGTGTFTFAVDCTDNAFDQTLTFTEAGSQTISGIPTGVSCTVTEAAAEGWTVTPGASQVAVIDSNGETLSFVNTRDTGSLTIAKTAVGGTGVFGFTVDCTEDRFDQHVDVTAGQSVTISGIPTGTSCTVTEDADDDWAVDQASQTVTVTSAGSTVTFVNTLLVAGLNLVKAVDLTEARVGQVITYTLVVSSTGTRKQTGVSVSDPIPDGSAYVPGSAGCVTPCTATYADGVVTWAVGDMAPGDSAELTFKVTVLPTTQARDILNSGVAVSDQVSQTPSNEVRTIVVVVLPSRIPPRAPTPAPEPAALPTTGTPISTSVAVAMSLLLGGASFQAVGSRGGKRAYVGRHRAG